jgi:hypothetical protein
VRVPKVGRDGLLAQVALDDVREVMASEESEVTSTAAPDAVFSSV